MRRLAKAWVYVAAALSLSFMTTTTSFAVSSSPQVLALVSIDKPMELLCFNGDCFVELSAFCLQPDYATPDKGTRYQVVGIGGIRATGYTPDGTPVSLDPTKHFELKALRTHVAVRMSMRSYALHKMNLARVEVTVAPNVSLVPAPSDKYEPQSEMSIAVATGPWRKIGRQIVDENQQEMSAARVTSHIANSLPPFTHVGPKTTKAVWKNVQRSGLLNGMRPDAVNMLTEAYQLCEEKNKSGGMTTMRGCISHMHDKFLGDLNMKYWDAIKGAS